MKKTYRADGLIWVTTVRDGDVWRTKIFADASIGWDLLPMLEAYIVGLGGKPKREYRGRSEKAADHNHERAIVYLDRALLSILDSSLKGQDAA